MSGKPCNLCDYIRRKREARRQGKRLRLVDDDGWRRVMVADAGSNEWKDGEVLYALVPQTCEC